MVAKMIRFYGFDLEYVYNLKTYEFNKLASAMEVLEAKEMLRDMKTSMFPHLKKEAKKELRDKVAKVANRVERENAKEQSTEEVAKALGFL